MSKLRAGRALALIVGIVLAALTLGGAVVQARLAALAAAGRFDLATVAAMTSVITTSMASSGTPGVAVGVRIPGHGHYLRTFGTANVSTGARFAQRDHVASPASPTPSPRP